MNKRNDYNSMINSFKWIVFLKVMDGKQLQNWEEFKMYEQLFGKRCWHMKTEIIKIPHIFEAMADFLLTEEGKQVLVDYVEENNLWNQELIKEIKEYNQNK